MASAAESHYVPQQSSHYKDVTTGPCVTVPSIRTVLPRLYSEAFLVVSGSVVGGGMLFRDDECPSSPVHTLS